ARSLAEGWQTELERAESEAKERFQLESKELRARLESECARSLSEAQARIEQDAQNTRERWEADFAQAQREADERAERAAEARRERAELEYALAESEAQHRRDRAAEDFRARWEHEQARARLRDSDDQVDQRELESLREDWAIENEDESPEGETRPDADSDAQRQPTEKTPASQESRDGGDQALESLRRRWQTDYERAERAAQEQA